MAAKTRWHRYGTKLRHCHPVYSCAVVSLYSLLCVSVLYNDSERYNVVGANVFAQVVFMSQVVYVSHWAFVFVSYCVYVCVFFCFLMMMTRATQPFILSGSINE